MKGKWKEEWGNIQRQMRKLQQKIRNREVMKERDWETKFKALMVSQSTLIPQTCGSQGYLLTARVASVYHPYRRPEGRVKALAGKSSMSIFIEWNWICSEDRPVLARLLLSPPALSDSPHRHLQNNHPNNTGSLQYVKSVLTPSPDQSPWKSHLSPQTYQRYDSNSFVEAPSQIELDLLFPQLIKPLRWLAKQHV